MPLRSDETNLNSLRDQLQRISPRYYAIHLLAQRTIPREILAVRGNTSTYEDGGFDVEALRAEVFAALDGFATATGTQVPVLRWGNVAFFSDEQHNRLQSRAAAYNAGAPLRT